MAIHLGASRLPPAYDPAASVSPHERSRLEALALDEWRCPRCGATADRRTTNPVKLTTFCTAGHQGDYGRSFNDVLARCVAANAARRRR